MKELIMAAALTLISAAPPSELPPTALVQEGDERTYVGTIIVCGQNGENLCNVPWDFDRWKRFVDMRRPLLF